MHINITNFLLLLIFACYLYSETDFGVHTILMCLTPACNTQVLCAYDMRFGKHIILPTAYHMQAKVNFLV